MGGKARPLGHLHATHDSLPPGLAPEAPLQNWAHGSGPQSRASSPGSDIPPGLEPDSLTDVIFPVAQATRGAALKRPQQLAPQLLQQVLIPGIGSTDVAVPADASAQSHAAVSGQPDRLRELSRSPILTSLIPGGVIASSSTSHVDDHRLPSSSLSSLGSATASAVHVQHAGTPEKNGAAIQQHEALHLQNGSAPTTGRSAVAQTGVAPIESGALPTEPVTMEDAHSAAHAPSYAATASGTWREREQQRMAAQASWQGLGATVAEVERQAATGGPTRPLSAQGRPHPPPTGSAPARRSSGRAFAVSVMESLMKCR